MSYSSRLSWTNTLIAQDIINWLVSNKTVEDSILKEAMVRFLINRQELVENYVENNISLTVIKRWLKIMTEETSRTDDRKENIPITHIPVDILQCLKIRNIRKILLEFCFILQEILKTEHITLELNGSERIVSLHKEKITISNDEKLISINLKSTNQKIIIRIGVGQESISFSQIECDMIKFVTECLTTCFVLCECVTEDNTNFVTKEFFPQIRAVMMDKEQTRTAISKILGKVKSFMSADRVNIFLFVENANELVAEYLDLGNDMVKSKITCQLGQGYCGTSAQTGKLLVVVDSCRERKSNNEVLKIIGCDVKSVICCPITSGKKLFGILQGLKFFDSPFGSVHKTIIKCMAHYCSFIFHLDYLDRLSKMKNNRLFISTDLLKFQVQKNREQIDRLIADPYLVTAPENIENIEFDYLTIPEEEIPKLFIYLCNKLLGKNMFPIKKFCNFIVTVVRSYRKVSYHNIFHAFNMTHCMYTLIKNNMNIFSVIEIKAMLVACICHDLDHRGYTNFYHVVTKSPLSALYTRSVLEHHHYEVTITILQEKQNDIFCDLNRSEYEYVVSNLEMLILATDFASFCSNKNDLQQIINGPHFKTPDVWFISNNRNCLKKVMMDGCDLSSMCKPWEMVLTIIKQLYKEFYHQGDEEKEMGLQPNPMMDRDFEDRIPEDQINFLTYLCIPIFKMLARCLSGIQPMIDASQRTLQCWTSFTGRLNVTSAENVVESHTDAQQ